MISLANYFRASNMLLPKGCSYEKWAVIACDQHTSEPDYWKDVYNYVGNAPSTLHMFFPEVDLYKVNSDLLATYSQNMRTYLDRGIFSEYPDSFIYIERTLANGSLRCGVLGVVDLEYYDFVPKSNTKIFATEATVLQRVPPRIELRKIADLEFSHTVVFCDDKTDALIGPITEKRDTLPKIYDFDLMKDGGHITGYLVSEDEAMCLTERICAYEIENSYLVGDGNHSLVTAKLTYEALKTESPDVDWLSHPARYAMVELENIHSEAMVFEPIYRIATCSDPNTMLKALKELDTTEGEPITWIHGEEEGIVHLPTAPGVLPIEALQHFLDRWMDVDTGTIDYIHGADTVRKLVLEPNTVGFLVPDFYKSILFPYILSGKVMPKKTFSIGKAQEKRYYLEGRKIK